MAKSDRYNKAGLDLQQINVILKQNNNTQAVDNCSLYARYVNYKLTCFAALLDNICVVVVD